VIDCLNFSLVVGHNGQLPSDAADDSIMPPSTADYSRQLPDTLDIKKKSAPHTPEYDDTLV